MAGDNPPPPYSILHILDLLKEKGLEDDWPCIRIEVNIDGRIIAPELRCLTVRDVRGFCLKLYMKEADLMRLEAVGTSPVPMSEVYDFVRLLAEGRQAQEANRKASKVMGEMDALKKRVAGLTRIHGRLRDDFEGHRAGQRRRHGSCGGLPNADKKSLDDKLMEVGIEHFKGAWQRRRKRSVSNPPKQFVSALDRLERKFPGSKEKLAKAEQAGEKVDGGSS